MTGSFAVAGSAIAFGAGFVGRDHFICHLRGDPVVDEFYECFRVLSLHAPEAFFPGEDLLGQVGHSSSESLLILSVKSSALSAK